MIRVALLLTFLTIASTADAQLLRRFRRPAQPAPAPAMQATANHCPNCGRALRATTATHRQSSFSGSGQAVAQARANYMAARGLKNHPPASVGGGFARVGRFEGVGWSSNGSAPTCIPGRRGGVRDTSSAAWRLVGDASARGRDGVYRARIWDRN